MLIFKVRNSHRFTLNRWEFPALLRFLKGINNLVVHDFLCLVMDGIHLPYPLHLIVSFELFCDACFFSQLFYQLKKEIFCSLVNFGKMPVQLAFQQECIAEGAVVFLQVAVMPLAPDANRRKRLTIARLSSPPAP